MQPWSVPLTGGWASSSGPQEIPIPHPIVNSPSLVLPHCENMLTKALCEAGGDDCKSVSSARTLSSQDSHRAEEVRRAVDVTLTSRWAIQIVWGPERTRLLCS